MPREGASARLLALKTLSNHVLRPLFEVESAGQCILHEGAIRAPADQGRKGHLAVYEKKHVTLPQVGQQK